MKVNYRFLRFLAVGVTIETVRIVIFHVTSIEKGILAANTVSLVLSLVVGLPLAAKFIWPDRGEMSVGKIVSYLVVWVVAFLVKLPLLTVLVIPCPVIQPILDILADTLIVMESFNFITDFVFSCRNVAVAGMDLFVAFGLEYILLNRLVFIKQ